MQNSFKKYMIIECGNKIKKKGTCVNLSFYAFFSNKNDNPKLLMDVAHWWIIVHKLDHFEKATKIRHILISELK